MTGISYSSGGKGSGLTQTQTDKLNNLTAPLKSNVAASASPTVTDDSAKGYAVGSSWTYGGTTYTCNDATVGAAVWSIPTDIYYFADWAALVAVINVSGSTYTGKFANVTNANGGPSAIAATYTAPSAISSPIADGNGAVYKVVTMGVGTYSVILSSRPPSAFRVTSVMTVAAAKPTADGFYIFQVTPSNALPAGVSLNDVAQLKATVWSVYQTYASAEVTVPVGVSSTKTETWTKTASTWTRPLVKAKTLDQTYEFASAYGQNSSWTNVQVRLGGMFFYWGNAVGSPSIGLTMVRDTEIVNSMPSTISATQISTVNNLAPQADNQNIWSGTAASIINSVVAGAYNKLVVDIACRDVLYKARWRLTFMADGSSGLSLIAEYWGPAYT
jgi:hypothetical protein